MSRKITQEEFLSRFYQRYSEAQIKILSYNGIKNPCKLECLKCGKLHQKNSAGDFLKSWKCCDKVEPKLDLIKRLCMEDGHYQFIKQVDNLHVIIKHLDCGNELTRTIAAAIGNPCCCTICDTRRERLRISLKEAQAQLDEKFQSEIEILFFDGVDSRKSQFRCRKCGLIFNQSHYNLLTKCRGCPKCDARRSKGERAMRQWLDAHNYKYNEQVQIPALGSLKFDFGILDNSLNYIAFIEVQGDQHFKEVFRYPSRPGYFKIQQQHDEQKREWCKEQGIPLYEIINDCGKLLNLDILKL